MDPLKIRFYAFLFGCIGVRALLTYLSAIAPAFYLRLLGLFACIPVLGWLYILFIEPRDTGLEVFGDPIWWKSLRPIHALLWGFFAYLAFHGNRNAWMVLAVDTTFGLAAFLQFHGSRGHFKRMLA